MKALELSLGLLVEHEKWGTGKVIQLDPRHVWVYFRDVEGAPKDAVRKLSRRVAVLTPAANQSDSALDHLPPMVRDGKLRLPDTIRLTESQAVDRFVRTYRRFDDSDYWKYEREYKWQAHLEATQSLLSVVGRHVVDDGPPDDLVKMLKRLIHKMKLLLATQECIALNDAFKDHRAAREFAGAILTFVDEGTETAFARLVEATGGLPAETGRARVLTWPVVTLVPFLAKPDRHMFLKPSQTRKVAETFFFDLAYSATPNWATYNRLLTLSNRLLARLRPLGARDLIDVQSFMWTVAGIPNRKQG